MTSAPDKQIKMSQLMSALSMATDISEGFTLEHGVKTCYLSLRLAEKLGLSDKERSDIFYTSFLQHLG